MVHGIMFMIYILFCPWYPYGDYHSIWQGQEMADLGEGLREHCRGGILWLFTKYKLSSKTKASHITTHSSKYRHESTQSFEFIWLVKGKK